MAAFKALASLGVDGVELDVQLTADGIPVVAHDVSIGGRRIEALTYSVLRELQGEAIAEDVRIPTLEEVLRVLPAHFLVNLEVKSEHAGPVMATAIDGAHSRYHVVVTSFDAAPLLALRQTAPEIRTGLVSGIPVADLLGRVREALADVVSLHWRLVTPELVRQMHDHGVAVYVWTVNTAAAAQRMIDMNVDAIITDEPDIVLPRVTGSRTGDPIPT
jgi:glycerophosphoryl diester phosphodiesterase